MLPTDSQARKAIPIYSGFVRYFPDAMAAVAQLSMIANEKHSPGSTTLVWNKASAPDELDCLMRHMVDDVQEPYDQDDVLHATKVAWRGMANLQRMADSGINIFALLSAGGETDGLSKDQETS